MAGTGSLFPSEFGSDEIPEFDTSDITPLPAPMPFGEDRTQPGVKSSRGAQVASVSGELSAQPRPRGAAADGAVRDTGPLAAWRAMEPSNGSARSTLGRAAAAASLDQAIAAGDSPPERVAGSDLPSVQVDREFPAVAEVMSKEPPPAMTATQSAVASESVQEPRAAFVPHAASLRVPSRPRSASMPPLPRTFWLMVSGAVLAGTGVGLLLFWLGGRHGAPAPAGSTSGPASALSITEGSPSTARSSRAGSGEMPAPVVAPLTESETTARESSAAVGFASSERLMPVAEAPEPYDQLYGEAKRARRHGDYRAALALANRALEQRQTAAALTIQAEALLALDDPDRALPAAADAVILSPRYAPAWYIKGRIHLALRHKDSAREAFERYLKIEPEGPRADQVIDLLHDM